MPVDRRSSTRGSVGVAARILVLSTLAILALVVRPAAAEAHVIERVSVSNSEVQADSHSLWPAISADGRFVAFGSFAGNLVSGVTNGVTDVFVRDRLSGSTQRVSVSGSGAQSWNHSGMPSISADGRYVVFESDASNLVSGDTNGATDIFLYDRHTGTIQRMSVSGTGAQGNANSWDPAISADGRFVAFGSFASNLVTGDINNVADVFVCDRVTGTTERVSVSTAGTAGNDNSYRPSVSADGRFVAFASDAADLVSGDQPGTGDVFVRDRQTGVTALVSVSSEGVRGNHDSWNPSISADGRYVAFESDATRLVPGDTLGKSDVFVRDLETGTTERVSVAGDGGEAVDWSYACSISADGSRVVFTSLAGNLVPGDTNGAADVFVRDRKAGTTERVSVSATGAQANGGSSIASISGDGHYLAFTTAATNLTSIDANKVIDDVLVASVGPRPVPVVSSVSPSSGLTGGGVSVVITGSHFLGATGPDAVTFGGVGARAYTVESSTRITATAPPHEAGTVQVQVTTDVGASGDTAGDDFTYMEPCTIPCTSLRGADRFETALKISQTMYPGVLAAGSGLVLAPGETFPEALCGAPLAAAYGGPVLLTPVVGLNNAVRAEIVRLAPGHVTCIGLSDEIVAAVQIALGPGATVLAIRGTDVYDMSYRVAKVLAAQVGDLSEATAIITRGDLFPDALGVSPLACAQKWPILLTDGPADALRFEAVAALSELGLSTALKVGTYAGLPAGVTGLANLSGADRYQTNRNVAEWSRTNAGLGFAHLGIATGDKFPDALAAGPYLALERGILLLSPLLGPLPDCIAAEISANFADVLHASFIAMIEPVLGQVKMLLP